MYGLKPAGLTSQGWQDLTYLSQGSLNSSGSGPPSTCSQLAPSLLENPEAWRAWFDHPCPESQPLPARFDERLSVMQKLLVKLIQTRGQLFDDCQMPHRRMLQAKGHPALTGCLQIHQSSATTKFLLGSSCCVQASDEGHALWRPVCYHELDDCYMLHSLIASPGNFKGLQIRNLSTKHSMAPAIARSLVNLLCFKVQYLRMASSAAMNVKCLHVFLHIRIFLDY